MVRAVPHSLDLKRQPNGHYSVSRTTETPGRTGSALVELDSTFAEIRRYETVGLTDTDGHDSILAPDGSRVLLAYEPNQQTGLVDAVIQKVDDSGQVVFEWNSRDHMDPAAETVATGADYAHVNSVWVMDDGDLLVSFRHLSSVYRIAMTPHDGHAVGDVVWRLGGRHSDFTFVDDPDGGPCAQHSATQLPDGHILLFDNGSWNQTRSMCVDPADPTGPTTMRTVSRITEYALDETTGEARLVWKYEVPDRFAVFAGSARRLANGNTLVGWAAATEAVTSEVSPAGDLLWELKDPGSTPHITYRALKFDVPDTQSPLGAIRVPAAGATYRQRAKVRVDFRCTDRGGSSLHGCAATTAAGALLDTSTPGKHVFRLTAVDGAGNTTVRRRVYTVSPASRPDALIRSTRSSSFVGDDVYGTTDGQQVWQRLGRAGTTSSFVIRLQNDGVRRDRFAVLGGAGSNRFLVTYRTASGPATAQLTNGTFLTPVLAPGAWSTVRLTVTRTRVAERGDTRRIRITATSTRSDRRDSVVAVVWAAPRRP